MADTKRPHVFLCHASEDKPAVRKLYERLVEDGIDAWLDEENLLPGQNWELEISNAVKKSDAVIVFLSSRSVKKAGFVQKEIKLALDVAQEKPEGTIFFIPARLDESSVPDSLREYQWVDLFDDKGYEKIKRALLTRIDLPEVESHSYSDKDTKLAQVTIIIERDILKFTDEEKDGFVYAISKLIGVSSNRIRVLQVAEGSVIITLELPEVGAKRLMELYYSNNFAIEKLYISKVTIKVEKEINHTSQVAEKDTAEFPRKPSSNQDNHLQKLKAIHTERLRVLELQSAKFGLSVPPHILLEIEEIKEKISQIERSQAELRNLYFEKEEYIKAATPDTPAHFLYLLDCSGSMNKILEGKSRSKWVEEAFEYILDQMMSRSKDSYKIAVITYANTADASLTYGGFITVKKFWEEGIPIFKAGGETYTVGAFELAYKLLKTLLEEPYVREKCPAPVVCHITDGEYNLGGSPLSLIEKIKSLKTNDGSVLVQNLYISDDLLSTSISNIYSWAGYTESDVDNFKDNYGRFLLRSSSPLPQTYASVLKDYGFNLKTGTKMMYPAQEASLIKLAFTASISTPLVDVL